jgi:putative transposase
MHRLENSQRHYPSKLSQAQWDHIKKFIPSARHGGRPRTTNTREVVNAILYLVNTGCPWRYLPLEFPPWHTVYDYFRRWSVQGVWKAIHDSLVKWERRLNGKDPTPTYLIIDSQSVKASAGEQRGYDGFNRVRGRKRQIMVDTIGLIHALQVQSAEMSDTKGGVLVLDELAEATRKNLQVMNADMGYRGTFEDAVEARFGFLPLIKRRENTGQGRSKTALEKKHWRKQRPKVITPKRWVVERSLAWLGGYRRLSRDYEKTVQSSVGMIFLAMIQLLLRRCCI